MLTKRNAGRKKKLLWRKGKGKPPRTPSEKRREFLKRRDRVVSVVPTLLTLGNAVCGFGAITFAAQWTGFDLATSMFAASCLIFLAMVFDALDGSTARRLNRQSEFGAQLDSLCDAISFGAAPAFLMIQFCLANGYHPRILWLIGALYVVCTVLRLARFNVETEEDDKGGMFSGLPSPAAAGTIASFPIMAYGLRHLDYTGAEFTAWIDWITIWALPVVTLAVACLMVSRFPYNHTFHYLVRGRRNGPYVIRLVFALAIIFVLPQVSAPLLFCWYAFGTPVKVTWQRRIAPLFNDRDDAAPPPEPDLPVGPPAPVAARDPRLVRPVDLPPTRLPN